MKAILLALLAITGTNAFTASPATPVRSSAAATQLKASSNDEQQIMSRRGAFSSFLTGAAAIVAGSVSAPQEANAEGSRVIGQISGSGLVFKDTLKVESFDDPKVKGVTLYVSNFERPLNGKTSMLL